MTDVHTSDSAEDAANTERHKTFEVFNPDRSVGVACYLDGSIAGVHVGDGVRDNTDRWLATEILLLSQLAYQKSRVGLRTEMAARGVLPHIIDQFEFPTEAEYLAMERAVFGE
jgi:hypothetical protein